MTLLGKLSCAWNGKHKRGKFLRLDRTAIGETLRVYGCPRCGNERSYKVKDMPAAAPVPNGGSSGEEA